MNGRAKKIRELNDAFRRSLSGGRVLITPGITAMGAETVACVLRKVAAFEDFSADNDPHHEHDMGGFDVAGTAILWKIDYYDRLLELGSFDPANPAVTTRVLTIMLASEY